MSRVEVLCPNGHRETINVTPNTKIFKILEEVCLRQCFEPLNEYDIRHGKRVLGLSLSFQETGLVNNTKLELVKRQDPWKENTVVIQIQTSTDGRLVIEASPSDTIYEVLEKAGKKNNLDLLKPKTGSPSQQLVIVYMKEEIIGEVSLKYTTLRSLGLIGGKVLIRHLFRIVDPIQLEKVVQNIKNEEEKYNKIKEKNEKMKNQNDKKEQRSFFKKKNDANNNKSNLKINNIMNINQQQQESWILQQQPQQTKQQQPHQTQQQPHQTQQQQQQKQKSRQPPEQQQQQTLDEVMEIDNSSFQPFLHVPFKFPEETKGKDLYRNEFSDVSKQEFQSCDREIVIFKIEEKIDVNQNISELPDSFFEVNEKDLSLLQKDLSNAVKQINNQPLMTNEMREFEKMEKFSKYKRVIIRFLFYPFIVQGVFRPRESVLSLHKFIKEIISNRDPNFQIYTSPPKKYLNDMTKNLIQASLAPMSIVYITCQDEELKLKKDLINNLKDKIIAYQVIDKWMPRVPSPPSTPIPGQNLKQTNQSTNQLTNKSTNQSTSTRLIGNNLNTNIPKWFNMKKK